MIAICRAMPCRVIHKLFLATCLRIASGHRCIGWAGKEVPPSLPLPWRWAALAEAGPASSFSPVCGDHIIPLSGSTCFGVTRRTPHQSKTSMMR